MLTYSKKLVLLGYHTWLLNHNKNHMKVLLGNDPNPLSSNKQSLNGLLIDSEKRLRDCRLICNLDYSITKIDTKNIKTMNNSKLESLIILVDWQTKYLTASFASPSTVIIWRTTTNWTSNKFPGNKRQKKSVYDSNDR